MNFGKTRQLCSVSLCFPSLLMNFQDPKPTWPLLVLFLEAYQIEVLRPFFEDHDRSYTFMFTLPSIHCEVIPKNMPAFDAFVIESYMVRPTCPSPVPSSIIAEHPEDIA